MFPNTIHFNSIQKAITWVDQLHIITLRVMARNMQYTIILKYKDYLTKLQSRYGKMSETTAIIYKWIHLPQKTLIECTLLRTKKQSKHTV